MPLSGMLKSLKGSPLQTTVLITRNVGAFIGTGSHHTTNQAGMHVLLTTDILTLAICLASNGIRELDPAHQNSVNNEAFLLFR
jgi:hypothetical protein